MISQQVELLPKALHYLRQFAMLSPVDAVERADEKWFTQEALLAWEIGEVAPSLGELLPILEVYSASLIDLQILLDLLESLPPEKKVKKFKLADILEMPHPYKTAYAFAMAKPDSVLARATFDGLKRETLLELGYFRTVDSIVSHLVEVVVFAGGEQ